MNYKLTATNINRRKQPGRMTDGHRLFWRRNKNGTVSAVQKISINGKDKDILINTFYGVLTSEQIDTCREKGRNLRLHGLPDEESETEKTDIILGDAWDEFYKIMVNTTNSSWSDYTAKQNKQRIENHIKPSKLWNMPIKNIHVSDLYGVLSVIRKEKRDTEQKIRGVLSKIFRHFKQLKVVNDNPLLELPDLYKNTEKPTKKKHLASIIDLNELGKILNDNEYSAGSFLVRKAVEFQAFTCQRSTEIVQTQWSEIDFDKKILTIPRERMKFKNREYDQVLELPDHVIELLESIPKRNKWVFPSNITKTGYICRDSMSHRLRRALNQKGKHVPHGWRSSLKTLATQAADEEGRPLFAKEWIEATLDHEISDTETEKAYQREHPTKGVGRVLAWWAEQLKESRRQ